MAKDKDKDKQENDVLKQIAGELEVDIEELEDRLEMVQVMPATASCVVDALNCRPF